MIRMAVINLVLTIVSVYLLQKEHFIEALTTEGTNTENEIAKQIVIDAVQEIGRKISYAQWEKDPSKNVILSPLSIAAFLNLLILGTNGPTNLEIKQALNYPYYLQDNAIHETYKGIFSSLPQSGNGVEISLYTRIFPQKGFPILDSFTSVSETSYLSEVESLDFKNSAEASTDRINNWVSESTNGKIGQLFPKPLSTESVCVIANVIFLNATWKNQFSSSSTKDGKFYAETETITIPMMRSKRNVLYLRNENKGCEMISLPYVGNRFSMYILKPIGSNSLQQIEESLNANDLNSYISQMVSQSFIVIIPRMKLSLELNLNDDLNALGINQIFNDSADFGRFTNEDGISVSLIVHKAILEVTEAGTVAAAVTGGVVVATTSVSTPPPIFELNKPSLVFIRDNENGLILFWARVMRPEPLP